MQTSKAFFDSPNSPDPWRWYNLCGKRGEHRNLPAMSRQVPIRKTIGQLQEKWLRSGKEWLTSFIPLMGQKSCVHMLFNINSFYFVCDIQDEFLIYLYINMCIYVYHNSKQAGFLNKEALVEIYPFPILVADVQYFFWEGIHDLAALCFREVNHGHNLSIYLLLMERKKSCRNS